MTATGIAICALAYYGARMRIAYLDGKRQKVLDLYAQAEAIGRARLTR